MDLRQLEYVVAVADEGGFTAGAAAVHVAQPSLSARVRGLERELGVELFHRLGRGVRLSPAGETVVAHARRVLGEVAALRATAAEAAGLEGGRLDLAALPTLAVDPLASLVGRFRRAHPRVGVRVTEGADVAAVVEQVRTGRAEVGLTELPVTAPDLIDVGLEDQQLYGILPAQTAIGGESTSNRRQSANTEEPAVDLRRIAGAPLVLTPPGTSSRRVVEAALAALGLEPVVAVEVAQREAIVPLVLAGAGVGFVPWAQAEAARSGGATVLSLDPPLVRHIGLVHRPGRPSPAARVFLELASPAGRAVLSRSGR